MIPDLSDYTQTLLLQNSDFGDYNVYFQKRVLWTVLRMPNWDNKLATRFGFIPIPTLL